MSSFTTLLVIGYTHKKRLKQENGAIAPEKFNRPRKFSEAIILFWGNCVFAKCVFAWLLLSVPYDCKFSYMTPTCLGIVRRKYNLSDHFSKRQTPFINSYFGMHYRHLACIITLLYLQCPWIQNRPKRIKRIIRIQDKKCTLQK